MINATLETEKGSLKQEYVSSLRCKISKIENGENVGYGELAIANLANVLLTKQN